MVAAFFMLMVKFGDIYNTSHIYIRQNLSFHNADVRYANFHDVRIPLLMHKSFVKPTHIRCRLERVLPSILNKRIKRQRIFIETFGRQNHFVIATLGLLIRKNQLHNVRVVF